MGVARQKLVRRRTRLTIKGPFNGKRRKTTKRRKRR